MNDMTGPDTRRWQAIDAARHLHPFTDHSRFDPAATRVMVRGKGVYLWDSEGKCYMDGISGLFCAALGYGREELVAAATRQMQELSYCSLYYNTVHPAAAELAERLFAILPPGYGRILYANSGSEANEVLIRVVRQYWKLLGKPKRTNLIGRYNGYHGSTTGSASLGGMKIMHQMGGLPIPGVHHIGEPNWFGYDGGLSEEEFGLQAARQLEDKILELGADTVAAFVAEPIQGAGGMIFAPSTYWPEIQRICRKYDILLCLDEVIGGFGRVGEWFSHQLYGLEPDTISIAKGLTSGYVPMGGLVLSEKIADVMVHGGSFAHGFTYQGHPLAAAVACASLALLDEGGIVHHVRDELGPYFQRTLREVLSDHPLVWGIQGQGLAAAMQLAPSKGGKQRFPEEDIITGYCMYQGEQAGVLFRPVCGRLVLAPPLVATREEIHEIVRRLRQALDRTAQALQTR